MNAPAFRANMVERVMTLSTSTRALVLLEHLGDIARLVSVLLEGVPLAFIHVAIPILAFIHVIIALLAIIHVKIALLAFIHVTKKFPITVTALFKMTYFCVVASIFATWFLGPTHRQF